MSERKVAKNQIYELSPGLIGKIEERVPRQLRKGVPDEYSKLLQRARVETSELVEQQLKKAAKRFVPQLYNILKDAGYTPFNARIIIVADCKSIWTKTYVETYLPAETKNQAKAIGAKVMVENRRKNKQNRLEEIKDKIGPEAQNLDQKDLDVLDKHPKLVGLAAADQETRDRVAKAGGDGKRDKYGNEVFSEMGNESADKWTKLKEQYQTVKVAIEGEEHTQLVNAYQKSLIMRANGSGGYIIFVKNGEFERVEPSNGTPEKTENK